MKKLPLFIIALFIAFQSLATEVIVTGLVSNSLDSVVLLNHKIKLINLSNPKIESLFTVSGFVIQEENNERIKNYPVSLYKNMNFSEKITIYTDNNGFYTYTYKPPTNYNDYTLLETRGNCDNYWTNYTDTIKSYESDYSHDFYICHDSLWYLQDFIIKGYVFDELTSEPVENHPVYIIKKKELEQNLEIYTDENGFFCDTLKIDVQDNSEFDVRTYSYCGERQVTHYNNTVIAFAGTYYKEFFICIKENEILESCETSFFYYQSIDDLKVFFFDFSENMITNRTWTLGDGTIKSGTNIEHIYKEEGVYEVCLTVETELACTTKYCKKIVVGNRFGFSGNVYASGIDLPEGIMTFFKYERKSDSYKYTNYTKIYNGDYKIDEMIIGEYLLFAVPIFDVNYNYFPKYLPTYLGEKSSWQNANPVLIDRNTNSLDINLLKYEEIFYGQAEISGNVDLNNNAKKEQITVTLLNEENVPMDFRILDDQNNFSFAELPYGNYRVITECAGRHSNICNVFVSEAKPVSPKINFVVNEKEIDFYIVNIDYIVANQCVNVYPNPFCDKINVNSNITGLKNIEILDISGKIIYSEKVINNYDNFELNKDFSSLPKGIYFFNINNDKKIIHSQKIIKLQQ